MPFYNRSGVKLHYEEFGKGEAIILLYGLGGNTTLWKPQVTALSPFHRVILLDQRGQGKSDSPLSDRLYEIDELVDDLYALLDFLGIEKACVGGQSLGGGVATRFALKYPERTQCLIVCNSHSASGLPSSELIREMRDKSKRIYSESGFAAMMEYVVENDPNVVSRYHALPEKAEQIKVEVKKMFEDTNELGYVNTIYAMKRQNDISEEIKNINLPVLLISGEYDPSLSSIQFISKKIKDATLVTLPDAGHYSNLDNPDMFNEVLLEFIAKSLGLHKCV